MENTIIIASGTGSEVVVEGLAELTKEQKVEKIKVLQTAKKNRAGVERKRLARIDKLIAFRDGVIDEKLNPKGHHNPGLMPETLRAAVEGELINGSEAKGWIVTIRCQHEIVVTNTDETGEETEGFHKEICGTDRLINTQDAFQTRFCEDHKGEAAKVKARERRANKKDAELLKLSDADLDAQLASLEAIAA